MGIGGEADNTGACDGGGAGAAVEVAGVGLSLLQHGQPRDRQRDLGEEERRRGGETERRRDGEKERRRGGETERRRDGEEERRRDGETEVGGLEGEGHESRVEKGMRN